MQAFEFTTVEESPVGSVLHEEHLKRVAPSRLAPFAGYLMPLWFSSIRAEHQAVRRAAGLFDCTHMGVLQVSGPDALGFLQTVTTNDVARLTIGKAQYAYVLDAAGRVLDDVILYRRGEETYLLVVNAGNAAKIKTYFRGLLRDAYWLERDNPERVLTHKPQLKDLHGGDDPEGRVDIALQGPRSLEVLARAVNGSLAEIEALNAFEFCEARVAEVPCLIARTGYTGAKAAYELLVPPARAAGIWTRLLEEGKPLGLVPCGLGARDSLRIEAGLPLYGHELAGEHDISPIEAGYGWAVKLDKPFFIGKAAMLEARENRSMRVVRLCCSGRKGVRPLRAGDAVLDGTEACVGWILSSATAGDEQYALALVDAGAAAEDSDLGIYYLARHAAQAAKGRLEKVEKGRALPSDLAARVVSRFARF